MLLVAGLLAAIYFQRHRLRVGPAIGAVGLIGCLYISPFCALGSALFAVRIVHDVVLVSVLAPLVVAALRLERLAIHGSLVGWTVIHVLTFWLWHAPPFYEAAMSSDATFWAMQVSIVATASLWWVKVFRAPAPAAATVLLATMVAMGSLGALLTFAHRALYAPHWLTTQDWGLSPLEDQQIAGIIMWAPGSLVYLLAALTIVYRSLGTRAATI
ncbi:cytochrome c oxidase assembly protein [Croceicoccus gelatinilyticus]|uniref:cytochrome c oxidase assembly protein n=1 Tax=Croceicoccus gelatinilyticus TaxID=2835536 RepID=UPI001BCF2950|nr:cytochrome c oxidase assembly protein [Croceicoccus gelatinilyticus]MBS7668114.1 cytochrome c oxidase assembly protein [Croceicoccus gelatinilyticus]